MYSRMYRKIMAPLYETILKGRNTLKYLKYLEESQWYSREKLKSLQMEKMARLIVHAYKNVPYYRKMFDKQGIGPESIKTREDFAKIPFLTKKDIRDNQKELLADNYKDKKIFDTATGGSTGSPVRLKLDHDNYEWRQAAVKRVYGWAGYADGEKTVFVWGGSVGNESVFNKSKQRFDKWLKRHRVYSTFDFTSHMMKRYLKEINAYHPKTIVAYTSPLYSFAGFIKENGLNVYSPNAVIAAAEKMYLHQRQLIEEVFDCPVFETYGCREVTSIAGECPQHNGMHINMENVYLEIAKQGMAVQPGVIGDIVLTDLTNYCMPLIRYKNEDVGSLSDRRCACDRGLVLLEKVEGRTLDIIQTPDGKFVPGEFFPHLMKEFEEVDRFQVRQEDLNNIWIDIIKRKDFSSARLTSMRGEILKVMGGRININLRFVDDIPLAQSGKFRVVSSKVPVNFGNNQS